ncbi:ABC-three component system middle component 6 [Rhodopirellula bahusiensis]|uniref:Transposase n=1 Tax=Rhodopirellula bahusiensis TaxID=2014065 RepID=A0A2G1W5F8_9BACT|nr:ABC-three component system middle component 6 [Rhodopirellula bahusiensis]PHQ34255.1 hypothetical protein CEE69_16615 [Rhodopirellula bahusiensis]
MILPTKHLPTERSLIAIGADIVGLLDEPKSVSKLWLDFQKLNEQRNLRLTFDWFTLAIAMLYAIDAVEQSDHRLLRREVTQ